MQSSKNAQGDTLLVVEDNPDDQALLRIALKKLNLSVQCHFVSGATEAFDWLESRQAADADLPGVILLDLDLSGLNGAQITDKIRNHPRWNTIPIVMFTTSAATIDIQRCYEAGCNGYFVKPYGVSELVDVLESIARYWLHQSHMKAPRTPKSVG